MSLAVLSTCRVDSVRHSVAMSHWLSTRWTVDYYAKSRWVGLLTVEKTDPQRENHRVDPQLPLLRSVTHVPRTTQHTTIEQLSVCPVRELRRREAEKVRLTGRRGAASDFPASLHFPSPRLAPSSSPSCLLVRYCTVVSQLSTAPCVTHSLTVYLPTPDPPCQPCTCMKALDLKPLE